MLCSVVVSSSLHLHLILLIIVNSIHTIVGIIHSSVIASHFPHDKPTTRHNLPGYPPEHPHLFTPSAPSRRQNAPPAHAMPLFTNVLPRLPLRLLRTRASRTCCANVPSSGYADEKERCRPGSSSYLFAFYDLSLRIDDLVYVPRPYSRMTTLHFCHLG
ncbi:hypothetical protein NUW54_g14053 [Trametes sanguinea]|uniref:Uncharacterized protein n=1 Tax=Trametes sanguinea TaxID=158606 RepID=A0ACC1MHA2_9APHY|nr:hypothetical protein NUW54_g14053 [Trametes sanguinea]